ncbi:MFS transporter [Devosia sp.]|uniref:MFS transporter n=1 Tax=Devosia sp. TaxID=1871048 RepID=UPI003267DCF5
MTTLLAVSIFISGVTFATTIPYGAIVGIELLHMSPPHYAAVLSVGSIVSAIVSVLQGYISDRLNDRRWLVLSASVMGSIGYGLLYVWRTPLMFTALLVVFVPLAVSIFSQSFAYLRAYADDRFPRRSQFLLSLNRTIFSMSWVVVPPVAGAIAAIYSVFDVYLATSIAYATCGVIFAVMMLSPATRVAPMPIIKKEKGAVRGPLPVGILTGIAGVFLAKLAMRLVGIAIPLSIISSMGGTLADVGLYAGIAALLEIPFMLGWGYLAGKVSREAIIIFNAILLGVYIFLVARATSVTEVFWLQGLNGIASSALLSITISYVQDAIKGRLGLSTSLMDVIGIASTLVGAAIFGAFAVANNYTPVLLIAAGTAVAGGLVMLAGNLKYLRRPAQLL